jgi:hypothetical protein
MTSEGLWEMFEGDSADTSAGKFPLVSMGDERTVKRAQTGSEDPHRRERKFSFLFSCCFLTTAIQNHRRGCRRAPK